MREILFRGQDAATGDWIKGFYVHLFDDKGNDSHRIYSGYAETDCEDYYPDFWEVDPETVGQFTGLTDKNGKKIFEGDLISDGGMNGIPRVVRWIESSALFKCPLVRKHWAYDYNDVPLWSMQSEKTEVIGNIHDNPELLEGE